MSRYISPLWLFLAILSCFVLFAQSVSGPSGTLAFRRGGDIWIKPLPDGAAVQMSQGGGAEYPEWSSSGQWLSFRQNGKLTVMPANGNRERGACWMGPACGRRCEMSWQLQIRMACVFYRSTETDNKSGSCCAVRNPEASVTSRGVRMETVLALP